MADSVRVCVAATPRLLRDLVAANLAGDGIEVITDDDPLVSVVSPDLEGSVRSPVVVVLGDSTSGDVRVVVDGRPEAERQVDACELRGLVLDLADRVRRERAGTDPALPAHP